MTEHLTPDESAKWQTRDGTAADPGANPALAAQGNRSQDEAGYRLAAPEPPPSPQESPPAPSDPTATTFEASSPETQEDRPPDQLFPDEPPAVDEMWSRWAEWRVPLLWALGGTSLSLMILIGGPWIALLIFLVAILYAAYQVVISLEVPVRVTPEQAVREFFMALGHRLPNFRRMYALLTADGKQSDEFSDFTDFRSYWQEQVGPLCRSPMWLVPLEFRVLGFKCRYNGEKNMAAVRYRLLVTPRGSSETAEPTAEFDMHQLIVKGPDGQWYLNDGTLGEPL